MNALSRIEDSSSQTETDGGELDERKALELARRLVAGELSPEAFADQASGVTAWLDDAAVDLDRQRRCGFPEVVFGPGKSPATTVEIARRLHAAGQDLLVTRIAPAQAEALQQAFPMGGHSELARTFRMQSESPPHREPTGSVTVVTAGTSDLPVAEEAAETLRWMRVPVDVVADVGVAGPQRLLQQAKRLREACALVVVAGMEGALPSVVGGHVEAPIIAVPTSVGYGANLGGIAALLSMLNSCAANVAVVNIDAGFRAGYLAGLIATKNSRE